VHCLGYKEEEKIISIGPDYVIKELDKLLFAGPNKNLEKLTKL
jgi:K+/H+ antiporter YhaU regulatory subunit KhtT